jgi:TRAP-type mannitol/chloroaromatic compound transport system permease small subunit
MQSLIEKIERITTSLGKIFSWLIVPLILALCYEVFARYILKSPTIWAFDITYMLMATIFLMAAAYTLSANRHIRIDVLYGKFSSIKRAWVDLIGYAILFLPLISLLAYFAIGKVIESIRTSETSDLSPWHPIMWPFRLAIALCFCFLTIQGICEVVKSVLILRNKRKAAVHE